MTLDLDLFRADKGGDPDKMRKNQKDRYKDVGLVETVIEQDNKWRQLRYKADAYNRIKNLISKGVGERMKKKEQPGETNLPEGIVLHEINAETLQTLSLGQLKALKAEVDKSVEENGKELLETEKVRNEALKEVGNILHSSVPVDDDEDHNRIERTWGDLKRQKKYSHVDLIVVSRYRAYVSC